MAGEKDDLDPKMVAQVMDTDMAGLDEEEANAIFEAAFGGDPAVPVEGSGKAEVQESFPGDDDFVDELGDMSEEEEAEARSADADEDQGEKKPAAAIEPTETLPAAAQPAPGGDDDNASPEDLRKRLRTTEAKLGRLQHQLESFMEAGGAAARDTAAAGNETPTAERLQEALKSADKMASLREDFPEFAAALDQQMQLLTAGMPNLDTFRREMQNAVGTAVGQVIDDLIEDHHEGWVETIQSEGFNRWFELQDDETKALEDSTRPRDAIKLLDKYKEYSDWLEKQPAEVRQLRDEVLLANFAQRGANSSSNSQTPGRRRSNRERLEAAVPATTPRGADRGSRREALTPEEIFEKAAAGEI